MATLARGTALCVGLDPRPELFPDELRPSPDASASDRAAAAEAFCIGVLDAVAPHVVAVKLQSAFFETWGSAGIDSYERVADRAKRLDLMTIADVKRGDIGPTAEAYAAATFGPRATAGGPVFDAMTVNPYFGSDGVAPFIERAASEGAGVFALVKTSNPSSTELQDVAMADGRPLFELVADLVLSWADGYRDGVDSCVGAVVGGTWGQALARLRGRLPGVPLLIPGIGAQGGSLADAVAGFDERGTGAIVSLSRAITYPWTAVSNTAPAHWRDAIADAARDWRASLAAALASRG